MQYVTTIIKRVWGTPLNRLSFLTLTGLLFSLCAVSFRLPGDFEIFVRACTLFLHRQNPYDLTTYQGTPFFLGFTYPPTALFLTLWACCLSTPAAYWAWTVASLLAFSVLVYMWGDLIWQRPMTLPFYTTLFILSLIPPVIWNIAFHQLTLVTLLLATAGLWFMVKKEFSFIPGIFAGLMLVKPHLTILCAAILFIRSPSMKLFACGFLVGLLLPIAPFLVGYRPSSDLADFARILSNHGSRLYMRDDQNIISNFYRNIFLPFRDSGSMLKDSFSKPCSVLVSKEKIRPLIELKVIFYILTAAGYFKFAQKHEKSLPFLTAIALAIGVLGGPYSHLYDAVLLIPLLLYAMASVFDVKHLNSLACYSLILNSFLSIWIPLGFQIERLYWVRTGGTAMFYWLLCLLLFAQNTTTQNDSIDKSLKEVTPC